MSGLRIMPGPMEQKMHTLLAINTSPMTRSAVTGMAASDARLEAAGDVELADRRSVG